MVGTVRRLRVPFWLCSCGSGGSTPWLLGPAFALSIGRPALALTRQGGDGSAPARSVLVMQLWGWAQHALASRSRVRAERW
jgi:hypothetical protein